MVRSSKPLVQYLEAITSVHNLKMYHTAVIRDHLEVGHEVEMGIQLTKDHVQWWALVLLM
jgi:hypothetical protein